MATKIEIMGFVEGLTHKTTIYTPIIEAIVNSIHAIEDKGINDGEITIRFIRENTLPEDVTGELPRIKSIEVIDNGIGFTEINKESFETIYSRLKFDKGGKGFGRITFLKYFDNISIDSVFENTYGKFIKRTFSFVPEADIIKGDSLIDSLIQKTGSKLLLHNIKADHINDLEKKLDTIARNILEKILVYFVDDKYVLPKIILLDQNKGKTTEIVLNDFLKDGIIHSFDSKSFSLTNGDITEKFLVKVFKVFYTQSNSSINLTAHNREVSREPLYKQIPEFKDNFVDPEIGNYVIKAYVLSDYLNRNVDNERNRFNFPKNSNETIPLYPFSQQEIEQKVAELTKGLFLAEVTTRQDHKRERIKKYIDSQAPRHKPYFDELDISNLPYDITEKEMSLEIEKIIFDKTITTKTEVEKIVQSIDVGTEDKIKKISDILSTVSTVGKDRLAQYVCLRKYILDLFKKTLEWSKDQKYDSEAKIHNIIFPMKHTSSDTNYEDYNLRIIDERLSFSEFVNSDKPLESGDAPDLHIFDCKVLVREGDMGHNPITIVEFKKPQRESYVEKDNPLTQIYRYLIQIRDGKSKTLTGRDITVLPNTPAYGFLICDLTPKIREFCTNSGFLTETSDGKGYIGYHKDHKIYIEVISYDKLLDDATTRNKIFFNKLGII